MLKVLVPVLALWAAITAGSPFPPTPGNATVIKSKFNNNITISYREVSLHPIRARLVT